tara:strand:+ start:4988 stop:7816 length:2829 start_codon:yes stop_codon:yes gene_type:complete
MKIFFLISFLFLFVDVYTCNHDNFVDKNEVRYFEVDDINEYNQNVLRSSTHWKNFLEANPNWFVVFDELTKLPNKAFGNPFSLNTNDPIKMLDVFSTDFLAAYFSRNLDLRLDKDISTKKYRNIIFKQYFNNLEVLNSNLRLKINSDNKLCGFNLNFHNDIDISTNALISKEDAIASSTSGVIRTMSKIKFDNNLKILPIPNNGKYQFELIYSVEFETRISIGPARYLCYVSATTGELLMRKNQILYEAPAPITHVEGELYTTHPFNPSSVEDLVNLKIENNNNGSIYHTDNNGNVNINANVGTSLNFKLEGLYAKVQTNNIVPSFNQSLANNSNALFDNSNSTIQERTAYRAVNVIHNHLKSVFPTFTALDIPLETNIDEAGSCNAFYNGNSINFYADGLSANGTDYCEATANIADVVYHEYGHAINGNRYNSGSGMWNGALNEGYADIWAYTITLDPILGTGFYQNNPSGYVRRFDINKKVYPQDLVGEVHADGEIIAGAFWDLYLNMNNNMQQVINLFKETFDSGIDGPNGNEGSIYTDILIEVLYADDNDGNLSNGTPNDLAIIQAFALHGITLISNANITHNPVSSANNNTSIGIQANIQLSYPWALGNVNCYYRINSDTIWTISNMTSIGNIYSTSIPSQSAGTIIAYYLSMEDIYGMESGITPMKSNYTPFKYANLPFFILVGYELVEEEDFDFNLGFWQTSDPLDNATTGRWELGIPLGSYSDPNDPNTIVQTDEQHTPGGINCAFTGNASSAQASIGENDIDNGHTTLYSPYYDMTDYNDPAFTYWRWYTNNTGAEPNADWWQVKITEDGINWIPIENTITSDISWRRFAFRAKDYVNLSSTNVQLKFVASDSANGALSSGSLVEAAIDDLYLWDSSNPTNTDNFKSNKKKIIRITDLLGKEVDVTRVSSETVLLYIFSDGTVKKIIKNIQNY